MSVGTAPAISPATAVAKPAGEAAGAQAVTRVEPSGLEESRWRPALGLVCLVSVDLPLPQITVADFLQLQPGSAISTGWRLIRDVPLRVNGTLIAWGEFEGSGGRLAVRITEVP